jgi:hypothetical protein
VNFAPSLTELAKNIGLGVLVLFGVVYIVRALVAWKAGRP